MDRVHVGASPSHSDDPMLTGREKKQTRLACRTDPCLGLIGTGGHAELTFLAALNKPPTVAHPEVIIAPHRAKHRFGLTRDLEHSVTNLSQTLPWSVWGSGIVAV